MRPIHRSIQIKTQFPSDVQNGNIVYIGLGSNLGHRSLSIQQGIEYLSKYRTSIHIQSISYLYSSKAMYNTNQPDFYNAAIRISTTLKPNQLLELLKSIEIQFGRTLLSSSSILNSVNSIRYAPRTLDLDILLYESNESITVDTKHGMLQIPHSKLHERLFVLLPLRDVLKSKLESGRDYFRKFQVESIDELIENVYNKNGYRNDKDLICRVTPINEDKSIEWNGSSYGMGILNVTEDSFSDGGELLNNDKKLIEKACEFVNAGVKILDIGGQSTRPNADFIDSKIESKRVVNALQVLKTEKHITQHALFSVDTFHSSVAEDAIHHGAHLINDVSGGFFDPQIIRIAKQHQIPIILMHRRGDAKSMNSLANYSENGGVLEALLNELENCIHHAVLEGGLYPWQLVVDPGIGFSKLGEQNLEILKNLNKLKTYFHPYPILIGCSRKSFLKNIISENSKRDENTNNLTKDFATAATVAHCVAENIEIIRFHHPYLMHTIHVAEQLKNDK